MNKTTTALLIAAIVLIVAGLGINAYQHRAPASGDILVPPTETVATSTGQTVPDTSGNPLNFKIGQKKQVGTVSLTLHAVTEDSRCPANVNCIWAGRVSAEFDMIAGTSAERVTLHTDSSASFGGYDFKIEEVLPSKTSGAVVNPAEYTLTVSYISNN